MSDIPLFETMDEAIEAVAQHLPKGYRVIIAVEHHGYGVHLEDILANEIYVDGGDGMRSDVWDAIHQAKLLD